MNLLDSSSWNNEFYCHIKNQIGKEIALKLLGSFWRDLAPSCHSTSPGGLERVFPSYTLDAWAPTKWKGRKVGEDIVRNDKVQRIALSHAYKCRSLLQDIKIKKKKKTVVNRWRAYLRRINSACCSEIVRPSIWRDWTISEASIFPLKNKNYKLRTDKDLTNMTFKCLTL